MARKRFDDSSCSVARALNEVGDWWSLLIVLHAMYGTRRFVDFQQELGIAKNILVGKKKSAQQSGAELAMENLRKLEEEYKQAAIELAMVMEEMTEEQSTYMYYMKSVDTGTGPHE